VSADPPVTPVPAEYGGVLADVDPGTVRRLHLLGVAGTGMGAFAGMLKTAGYAVTGSDQNVFPPMSEALREWGIPVLTPYDPANLDTAKPDLVVVGNVIRRVNPEAAEARARRLPQTSFPAALGAFFLRDRHPNVQLCRLQLRGRLVIELDDRLDGNRIAAWPGAVGRHEGCVDRRLGRDLGLVGRAVSGLVGLAGTLDDCGLVVLVTGQVVGLSSSRFLRSWWCRTCPSLSRLAAR